MNIFDITLLCGPAAKIEVTAKMAEDSMSMVAMVLYNPLIPAEDPVAARTFLPCRTSRMTIMRVRRTLSEPDNERYGRPNQMAPGITVVVW